MTIDEDDLNCSSATSGGIDGFNLANNIYSWWGKNGKKVFSVKLPLRFHYAKDDLEKIHCEMIYFFGLHFVF